MSETIYILTLALPFVAVLAVFGMRYASVVLAARARLANDEAYRQLAEKAAATQSQTAAALASMNAALSELKSRLAGIETVLKQVE